MLRALLERVLSEYQDVVEYSHEDPPPGSTPDTAAHSGWGTHVVPRRTGRPFTVWFAEREEDIAVWSDRTGWRRRDRGSWFEWLDLSNMPAVLPTVEARLRALLADFK